MKEHYFTAENITSVAQEMLDEVQHYTRRRYSNFDYDKSALLVLDMQQYFLKSDSHAFIPSAPAIITSMRRLIMNFSANFRPIIFTRHINNANNAGSMKRWWKDMITEEDPGSVITPLLDTARGEVITKTQYDSFYNSGLHEKLQSYGVNQLVICGVMANLCCETTARSAFVRGYDVFFPANTTAAYNRFMHLGTLTNLSFGIATVSLSNDLTSPAYE